VKDSPLDNEVERPEVQRCDGKLTDDRRAHGNDLAARANSCGATVLMTVRSRISPGLFTREDLPDAAAEVMADKVEFWQAKRFDNLSEHLRMVLVGGGGVASASSYDVSR